MSSGRDTSLLGAQVSADRVEIDVGRDLVVASRQDTNTFRRSQLNTGFQADVCVPPFCYGQTVEGSAQAGRQALRNDFASVGRQSGVRAGAGGYAIEVGNHTQLDGGVIASKAESDRNSLSSATFGHTDLRNVARHSGSTLGFRVSGNAGQSTTEGMSFASPPQKVGSAVGPPASPALGSVYILTSGPKAQASDANVR